MNTDTHCLSLSTTHISPSLPLKRNHPHPSSLWHLGHKRQTTDDTKICSTNQPINGSVKAKTNGERQATFVGNEKSLLGHEVVKERGACEQSVWRHYKAAVKIKCTTYDVSGMGRKLPLVVLDHILKKIELRGGPSKLPFADTQYHVVPGAGLLHLKQPSPLLVDHDIMTVLAGMVYNRIIEKRIILEGPANSLHSQLLNGLRQLNGGRYELYMKPGRNNGNGAIHMIVNTIVNDIILENEKALEE